MSNASNIGIVPADFTDNALVDFGVTVSWEDCSKITDNITGDETLGYAEGTNITVVFVKRSQRYTQGKEGIVDLGDAYCMSEVSDGFSKNDRITYEGEKFLIGDVTTRRADGEAMFNFANCFKVED